MRGEAVPPAGAGSGVGVPAQGVEAGAPVEGAPLGRRLPHARRERSGTRRLRLRAGSTSRAKRGGRGGGGLSFILEGAERDGKGGVLHLFPLLFVVAQSPLLPRRLRGRGPSSPAAASLLIWVPPLCGCRWRLRRSCSPRTRKSHRDLGGSETAEKLGGAPKPLRRRSHLGRPGLRPGGKLAEHPPRVLWLGVAVRRPRCFLRRFSPLRACAGVISKCGSVFEAL